MISGRPDASSRGVWRWAARTLLTSERLMAVAPAILAAGFILIAPPRPAAAQDSADLLSEARLEYRSTLNAHQAAVDAWAAADRRFQRTIQENREARASGDDSRYLAGLARARSLSIELQDLEERVRDQTELLEEKREALVAALDARIEDHVAELESTADPAQQEDLLDLIRNLRVEIQEVEDGEDPGMEVLPVSSYVIRFDPRDLPLELEQKAELSDIRARQLQEDLEEIDRQIADLDRRIGRNRRLDDFRSNIQRFGDDQVPIGPQSSDAGALAETPEDTDQQSDSTGVRTRPLSLEERREQLVQLRDRIEEIRRQVIIQADLFRERLSEFGL